jgi:glucokinase
MLKDHFRIPCFIENDCNVAALAEATVGAGKGKGIVFYVTVSTGIGGGLCIDGKIFSGATGNAGEIANIIIKENGVRHSYLNPGSMEGLASGTGILRIAKEAGLDVEQTHEVFSKAKEGNEAAKEIVETAIDSLARGMAAVAHVIDPHVFVLGGGVALAVPDYVNKVKERFDSYIYQVMRNKIRIELAKLADPGMIGAMYMVKNRLERECQ